MLHVSNFVLCHIYGVHLIIILLIQTLVSIYYLFYTISVSNNIISQFTLNVFKFIKCYYNDTIIKYVVGNSI